MTSRGVKSITVGPAYGRDYKSAKTAREAWKEGKDFYLHAVDGRPSGTYCSNRDWEAGVEVNIRYNKLMMKTIIKTV